MARNFTLLTLVNRARKRVDMENDDSISAAEWKELVAEIYDELHACLVETGCRAFEAVQNITAQTTALPSDWLSTIGVDYVHNVTTDERRELYELMVQERNALRGRVEEAQFYEVADGNLVLWPAPPAGQTYKHLYVPVPTDYSASADGTNIDVVTPHGDKFIIWGVTMLACHKVERDPRDAERRFETYREKVYEWGVLQHLNATKRQVVAEPRYVDPASRRR
jgi:hypothetical protein